MTPDAPWIGKAVGIVVLIAVLGLLWLSRSLEKRGYFRNYSRGLGRGLFEVDAMLQPSKKYVREAREEKREVEDDQGAANPKHSASSEKS